MILLSGCEKGGVGKSNIGGNLGVYSTQKGVDTVILDADPMATITKFIARRNALGLPTVHSVQKTGDVYATAKDLAQRYQLVIIDAGGRDSKELRTAMVAADRMMVPMQASQADLETLPHMDELLGLARTMNPHLEAFVVLSRAPTNPMINEVAEARELFVDFDSFQLARSIIRERKIYRDGWLQGRGVVELKNGKARAEIQLLAAEMFPHLVGAK
jgi:chromosome partitioning protein